MRLPISRRFSKTLAAALLLLSTSLAHADDLSAPLDEALAAAKARSAPVIVDFYAPWCYSCYFMAKNVKNGPQWEALKKRAVVVALDADSPVGAHWMKQFGAKGLPSYVVLDANGAELGRISLERTRAQFYPEIAAITARGSVFEALKAKVVDGSPASLTAAREVLAAFAARRDPTSANDWLTFLAPEVRRAVDADPAAALWQSRLKLRAAYDAKDPAACAAAAPAVLGGELGCDRAYELDRALECTADLPAAERKTLFAAQLPAMKALLAKRVFVARPGCADARSIVLAAADLSKALGDESGEAALLDRAIADIEARLGGAKKLDLKRDRNLADNLRLYLDRAKRHAALDVLFPKLVAAYPDDYVYAYRHGKNLVERGEFARALPWLEQAAPKAYGVNRLNVAQFRAKALRELGREDDAKQVVADALKANGPFFPDEVLKVKAVLG
ncbi:thioredoxin family protein [Nevskia sp.]|uniref:thioredoxin family protein n=1 Tax=Nevskia sp. TaxID=1929292 RepID=UPI0025D29009|nr:thioredoxin family protein [Nevskia sp.]